jgi:hypothetical protein
MRKFNKSVRKQIRMIAEAIDDEPKLFGIKIVPGNHPIDQLIQYVQQNMVKWNWNDNKFIKAMRDVYHNAGKTVPSNREALIKDLQQQSEQDPKLLDQLISGLGGMSRRHFMGLSAGAGAGVATGMIDFAPHEKAAVDKTLRKGVHYKVTYRNWQNQTRLWQNLIFSHADGNMYWFMDPRRPRSTGATEGTNRWFKSSAIPTQTRADVFKTLQQQAAERVKHWQAILAGKIPWRRATTEYKWQNFFRPARPARYVKSNWHKTIERIHSKIEYWTNAMKYKEGVMAEPHYAHRPYAYITLQIENVVDVLPLSGK